MHHINTLDAVKNIHMTKQESIGFVHLLYRINCVMAPKQLYPGERS